MRRRARCAVPSTPAMARDRAIESKVTGARVLRGCVSFSAGRIGLGGRGLRMRSILGRIGGVIQAVSLALLASALAHAQDTEPVRPAESAREAPAAKKDRRLALVIGNAAYTGITKLDNSVNDARDVCRALHALNFETRCYEDVATRRQLKNVISDYVEQLRAGDVGVFYYAGHGLQVKGENYIVPTAAVLRVEADVEDEALSLNYLMNRLDEAKSAFNLVMLDACRNNPLARRRTATEGGLAPVDAPAGTMVIYATAPGKVAIDGEAGGKNGIFTAHLLGNIMRPGVTVEEMFKSVISGVQSETQKKFKLQQTPWINSSYTGRFCFAGCEDPDLSRELVKIRHEREALARRAKDLESDNVERDKRIASLLAEVDKSRKELEARSKELEKREAAAPRNTAPDPELARLEKQVQELRQANKHLTEQSESLQREKRELESLTRKLTELEKQSADIEALNKKLTDLERANREREVKRPEALPEPTPDKPKSRDVRNLPPTF